LWKPGGKERIKDREKKIHRRRMNLSNSLSTEKTSRVQRPRHQPLTKGTVSNIRGKDRYREGQTRAGKGEFMLRTEKKDVGVAEHTFSGRRDNKSVGTPG